MAISEGVRRALLARHLTPGVRRGGDRSLVVASARRDYRALPGFDRRVCSEHAWVNQTLRELNMSKLTDGEAVRLGIGSSSARPTPGGPPEDRNAVIVAARRSYRALDGPNQRVCSERAWVNGSLREHGLQLLANSEATAQAIAEQPGDAARSAEVERRIVIDQAKNHYDSRSGEMQVMEAEVDWINRCLRENGMGKLTAGELKEWSIGTQ